WYWRLFYKSSESTGKLKRVRGLCLLCRHDVSATTPSNLLHHTNTHHAKDEYVLELKVKEKTELEAEEKRKAKNGIRGYARNMKGSSISTAERNMFLGTYIVKDLEPLSTVESETFRDMQRGLHQNPDLSFPCRKTKNAWITDKAVEVKALIKEKVRGQPIALTGDGWDSTNGSGAFYALTAHMMDPDTNNLMAYTLACRKLADRHTGRK
ncbi:unnamed protein product, partial [Ectocarpus sp. 13 AM-2016]